MAANAIIPKIARQCDKCTGKEPLTLKIASHNWADEFPYAPEVTLQLWHDGKNLYARYTVDEKTMRAAVAADRGEVWTDSCVEMFWNFGEQGYYNLETTCIGRALMTHRLNRNDEIIEAPDAALNAIARKASAGTEPFGNKEADGHWTLELTIPATSFFHHDFKDFSGLKARANFYKCGDLLPEPHFMSWQPVGTPAPDFHRPEYFGKIEFEA